ncbi:MAG: 4-hydroxy-tetrahydrodipicolinate synthase [Candidatus Latescibacteria bacterium]|jgi:4-hydroxy-tetrahydrodipicolinate synthase|nr:4-hydroxy-tetrahydrodipicolinate synthase [Candidatus Latescibacterota bacterium]
MRADFIRGIIPAMITPMTETEALDEKGLQKLIDFLIDAGVHGVFAAGTAGEFWALSFEEKRELYERTVKFTDRRVPVYLGTGANSTQEAILLSRMAEDSGADCLSILTPAFITPSQNEMFDHFAAIADVVKVPILLYDLPSRTGNAMGVDLVVRLAESFENIVGIKDSTGDFSQSLEYLRRAPADFRVIMGRDTLIHTGFISGAAAAIAASANVAPALSVGIYECFLEGNLDGALEFQQRLAPLRLAFALGSHPAMLKAGADMVGAAGGPPRKPVHALSMPDREKLQTVLTEIGVLK